MLSSGKERNQSRGKREGESGREELEAGGVPRGIEGRHWESSNSLDLVGRLGKPSAVAKV